MSVRPTEQTQTFQGDLHIEVRMPNGMNGTLILQNATLTRTETRQDIYRDWEMSPVVNVVTGIHNVISGDVLIAPSDDYLDLSLKELAR